jgi:hypothetical protein
VSREGWHRVDRQRLRAAILEGDALVPLIGADSSAAAQLIQQAAIDSEAHSRFALLDEDGLGITDAPHWVGPLPERGPFLALLLNAPKEGLDCILSIVEHATQRWAEEATSGPEAPRPFGKSVTVNPFEVVIDADPVELVGDNDVMHWYRGEGRAPSVLSSAMMALEFYLYRRLDADEDVTPILDQLKQSRSLAVWGLLTEIARYRPVLLRGQLLPLVGSASILLADKLYTHHDHSYLLMPTLSDRGFAERIRSWNTMPHRKHNVIGFIMRYVLTGEALVDELAAARRRWAELDAERWKHLIAQTDPANHRLTELDDGSVMAEYVPPVELRPEVDESNREASESQFWLMLPYRLREWIDQGDRPSDEELEGFWAAAQERLAQPANESYFADRVRSRADIGCGLAALFVTCARDWLAAHPDRQAWCRRALLTPFESPPASHDLDFPGEPSTERWDVFCADALPVLWAEAPNDIELRSVVARLAVNPHYVTVRNTFRRVARQPSLADDLRRLEHLSLYWARFISWRHELRHREEYPRHGMGTGPSPGALPDLETPTRAALDGFVSGTLPVTAPRLRDWVAATPEGMLGAAMGARDRSVSVVSLGYLLAARSHFAGSLSEVDSNECLRRIDFAADLAALIAGGLVPGTRDRVDGTPYDDERAAFGLLARLTVQVTVEQARVIWRPILAAGGPARYWVEDYLGEVWQAALAPDRWPPTFTALVKEMLSFVSEADTWQGRRGEVDLALAIVGLDRWGHGRMQERHKDLLSELLPQWADWVRPRLRDAWFARRVVRFLEEPAAEPVRRDALGWLADRERSASGADSDLDHATAELLLSISVKEPELLRGTGEPAANARYLLARLAGRGLPLALELSARLS